MYILTKFNTIVGVNENCSVDKECYYKKIDGVEKFPACKVTSNEFVLARFENPFRDNVEDANNEIINIYNALKKGQQFYKIDEKQKEKEKPEIVINYDIIEGQHIDASSLLSFIETYLKEHNNYSVKKMSSEMIDYVFAHREGKKVNINDQIDYYKSFLEERGYITIKLTDAMKKACDECENSENLDDCSDCPCNICVVTGD